jgi:LPXTG-motif cell wall-anchored protein
MMSLGFGSYAWADPGNAAAVQVKQADGSPGNAYAWGQADGTANGATSQGADSSQAVSLQASSQGVSANTSQGGSSNASQNGADHASSHSQAANGATSQGTDSQARLAVTSAPTTFSATADAPGQSDNAKGNAGTSKTDAPGKSDHLDGNAGTSGTYSEPQPPSTADQNQGGANGDCGAYCSTRNGDPSGNGKGDDHGAKASGKPCAGCVGKADNKNPPGQFENGSDHNAGYECDRNQGIGKTNPAHTGCTTDNPPTDCVPSGANNNCGHGTPPGGCTSNCGGTPPGGCTSNCGGTPPGCAPNCDHGNPPGGCKPDCHNGTPPGPETLTCPGDLVMQDGMCGCPRGQAMVKGECTKAQIKGKQVFRPKAQVGPPVVAPAATGMPNTGADSGLGLDAMAGAGLLVAGGALLLLRRRLVHR